MATNKQLKSPKTTEQAERIVPVVQKYHGGMLKGDTPLSIIGQQNVYRYVNTVGFGPYAQGRSGTRRYSKAQLPEETFVADDVTDVLTSQNRYNTGDRVRVRSNGSLPSPLDKNTAYYVISISITTFSLAATFLDALIGAAIDITDTGTGTHYVRYYGVIRSSLGHKKEKKIVKQYGTSVYVANNSLETYNKVINLENVNPVDSKSGLEESGSSALLAAGDVFRIVLDEDFYYMYRLSCPVPQILLTERLGTRTYIYGYRYVFSFARINNDGVRNRLTPGSELVLETGTCKNQDLEIFYTDIYMEFEIGVDLANDHIIGWFTLPLGLQSITHFTLYRTKNIGPYTNSAGNNPVFFAWVDDIPVCKAMSITVVGDVATYVAGQQGWVRGDVGCTIRVNAAGTRTAVIEEYVSENVVNLVTGHTLNATEDIAIGEGRVMTASQTGPLVTRTAGDQFELDDEGRTLYWGSGAETVIKRYIDADNVEGAYPATHASQAATIQLPTGSSYAFRRKWNDTVKDDGIALGEIGLQERMLSLRDLYIPQIGFDPIPYCNIVKSDSGFTLFAQRDENDFWYSQIGAKPYIEGQYRNDQQYEKLPVSIRDIKIFPATGIIFCRTKTYTLALNVPIPNVGNPDVGEFISKLTPASEADSGIGVIHYETIDRVRSTLLIALTNEPAVRTFDGHNWSEKNFAISNNGLPAVMNDLNKIDSYYGIIGWYSHIDGYKLFAWKWSDV